MAVLPAVRALESDLRSASVDTLLLDIHDDVGAALAGRFDFRFSPTFLVFDLDGQEVWRSSALPTLADVQAALRRGE